MTLSPPIAPVRKSVTVKAPIAHAFEVFTSGLTRWWPSNHGIGKKPIAKVLLQPRLGGRADRRRSALLRAWARRRRIRARAARSAFIPGRPSQLAKAAW